MVCNNHILIVNYIYYNHVVAPYVTIQLEVHIYIYIEEYLCFRHFCVWGDLPPPPPPRMATIERLFEHFDLKISQNSGHRP